MTASAVANMAEGKRRLASRRGLAYAESNSAAAVKAALSGVTSDRERVRIATGSTGVCFDRVLLATGCSGAVGVGAGAGFGAGGGAGAAGVGCTLGRALSNVVSAALSLLHVVFAGRGLARVFERHFA